MRSILHPHHINVMVLAQLLGHSGVEVLSCQNPIIVVASTSEANKAKEAQDCDHIR